MIRWLIWPRQYGKTYRIEEWWLEDPENRVILCPDMVSARYRVGVLVRRLADERPDLHVTRKYVEERVMSFRRWQHLNESLKPGTDYSGCEVAVDEAEVILATLLRADIKVIAGAGRNEEPDPVQAAKAAAGHAQFAHLSPDDGIDYTVS